MYCRSRVLLYAWYAWHALVSRVEGYEATEQEECGGFADHGEGKSTTNGGYI